MANTIKSFRARLESDGTRLRWTVARVPFDIARAWPNRRGRRVRGTINGFEFRTSLLPDAGRKGHILLVNKKMQAGSGARQGDRVRIVLEPDLEERGCAPPPELAAAFRRASAARKWFSQLSPSNRREIGYIVSEPKSAEARRRRAEEMVEHILLILEGEQTPPPVLRAAFQRHPRAEAAWLALTPIQRRGHLYGVFACKSPQARQRRAWKAVAAALRAAGYAPPESAESDSL